MILTGAVTRGAFEAGALKILAAHRIPVRRIVAVSSGALNGAVYAAAIRARREEAMAEELIGLWTKQGGWRDVIHINVGHLLRGKGLSDQDKLLSLLRGSIRPARTAHPAPVELRIVVAPLRGAEGAIGQSAATTYTKLLSFRGEHFDDPRLLEEVFTATLASAAFPCLFTPVEVPGAGPCIDGGFVNSAPLRYAYDDSEGAPIDAVVVIAPTPTHVARPARRYRGRDLIAHVIDILFNELIYNDMRAALSVNETLRAFERLVQEERLGPEVSERIKAAIGWQDRRVIPVIPIRPLDPLPGDVFSGFFSASTRQRYVDVGMERASQVLAQCGWA